MAGPNSPCAEALAQVLVKETGPKKLTQDELNKVVADVDRLVKFGDPTVPGSKAYAAAARAISLPDTAHARRVRKQAVQFAIAVKANLDRMNTMPARINPIERVNTLLSGSMKEFPGAGDSISALRDTTERTTLGALLNDMDRDGVLVAFQQLDRRGNQVLARQVQVERAIANGSTVDVATNNPIAWTIGRNLAKYDKLTRKQLMDVGVDVSHFKGYAGEQFHDQLLVKRAGEGPWKQAIRDNFDLKRSFPDADTPEKVDKILTSIYNDIVTGWDPARDGRNLATRLATKRVFIPLDAQHGFNYDLLYGTRGHVNAGMLGQIRKTARNASVIGRLGPDPVRSFETIINKTHDQLQADKRLTEAEMLVQQKDAFGIIQKHTGKVFVPTSRSILDVLTGQADMPVNARAAHWIQSGRNLESLAKLGGMVFASFGGDLPARAATINRNGVGLLTGYANGFATLGRMIAGGARGEIRSAYRALGFGFDGMLNTIAARVNPEGVPGGMSRMLGFLMKINLANFWQDNMLGGAGGFLSSHIAENASVEWANLRPQFRTIMERYSIGKAEWDIARQQGVTRVQNGDLFFPDRVQDSEVRNKFAMYLVDQAGESMSLSDARARAWITQFGQPGSAMGEVARTFAQFKQFPISFARRQLLRGGPQGRNFAVHALSLVIPMSILGYLGQSARNLVSGKLPDDPTRPDTLARMALNSGGLGVYGDFLNGVLNRYDQGPIEAVAGPLIADIAKGVGYAAGLGAAAISGKKGDLPSKVQMFNTVKSNIPFVNLWYTRAAADRLIFWQIQEMIAPGSLARMEKNIQEKQGTKYWLSPSEVGR